MSTFDHNTPQELRREYEQYIFESLVTCFRTQGIDKVCKMMIDNNVATLNNELIELLSRPVQCIVHDKKIMFKLLNARFYMEAIENVVGKGFHVDPNLVTQDYDCDIDHKAVSIASDIKAFSHWMMYHGADPSYVRTKMNNKEVNLIIKTERRMAYIPFISLIYRAALYFKILCNVVIIPALNETFRIEREVKNIKNVLNDRIQIRISVMDKVEDDVEYKVEDAKEKFNTMACAFTGLKKTV